MSYLSINLKEESYATAVANCLQDIREVLESLNEDLTYRGYLSAGLDRWTEVEYIYREPEKCWYAYWLILKDAENAWVTQGLGEALRRKWSTPPEGHWLNNSPTPVVKALRTVLLVQLDILPITEEMYF